MAPLSSKSYFRLSLILFNLIMFVLLSEAIPAPEDSSVTPEAEEDAVEVTNPTPSDPNDDDDDNNDSDTEDDFGHHHGGFCRHIGRRCWNHFQCCSQQCIRVYIHGPGRCEYPFYYKK